MIDPDLDPNLLKPEPEPAGSRVTGYVSGFVTLYTVCPRSAVQLSQYNRQYIKIYKVSRAYGIK